MNDLQKLEKRIVELEQRLERLERAASGASSDELMEALYQKTKALAEKEKGLTAAFLQRKLWIDLPRAKDLLERLRKEGLVD